MKMCFKIYIHKKSAWFLSFHYVCNYYTVLFVFFAEYVSLWLLLQQIAWSSVQIIKSTKPLFFAVWNSGKLKYF